MSNQRVRRPAANSTATKRLKQDYMKLKKEPVPHIVEAEPKMDNILEWHYVVSGPPDTPYYGGFYHGKLVFPADYPFKPPSIYMITPNGRFKCNTRLCLSISDFHPDTWNPAWSVSTILTGLLSFMLEDQPTLGSISTTNAAKRQYALSSISYNLSDADFCHVFPELAEELREKQEELTRNGNSTGNRLNQSANSTGPQVGDNSSMLNHLILLVAVALVGYLVNTVLQYSPEYGD